MALTLAQAQTHLTNAQTALVAARNGSFSAGDFSSTPPSLSECLAEVTYWERVVHGLSVTASPSIAVRGKWSP